MSRALVAAAFMVSSLAGLGSAAAAGGRGKITPVDESHAGATRLARAMMTDPHLLLSGRFAAVPPDNKPTGISTRPLAGFPRSGSAYGILSTGCASLADHRKDAGLPGCLDNGVPIRGTRDLTILRVTLRVPAKANCLSFRFRFLSQEFPRFVGSLYNDGFIAELDQSTWSSGRTGDLNDPHITAPRNFAKDGDGNIISINSAGLETMKASYARGTTYGGATRVLRASTPVRPGRVHSLFLSIFDQGDRQYDSAVFIDQLTVDHRVPCQSGVAGTR